MLNQFFVIGLFAFLILVSEFGMWRMFRRHHHGIEFPHSADRSMFRFLTDTRMRVIVFCHTLFLLIVTMLSIAIVW